MRERDYQKKKREVEILVVVKHLKWAMVSKVEYFHAIWAMVSKVEYFHAEYGV